MADLYINTGDLDSVYDDKAVTPPRNYPRMGDRMSKIIRYIEIQLGAPVLELELTPENIKLIVEQAFEEIEHYMSDLYTVTLPYAQCIDVSKYNIDAIESVVRANDSVMTGLTFVYPYMGLNNITGAYNLEGYADALLSVRNMNIVSTDMDFHYDKPNRKLYVVANPNVPAYVTLIFKPEYYTVEDIKEQYWDTQLRRLALGMCKVVLGRIRSKYKSNTTKFQLDGDTLLAEGTAEIDAIRQRLDGNRDIFTVLN